MIYLKKCSPAPGTNFGKIGQYVAQTGNFVSHKFHPTCPDRLLRLLLRAPFHKSVTRQSVSLKLQGQLVLMFSFHQLIGQFLFSRPHWRLFSRYDSLKSCRKMRTFPPIQRIQKNSSYEKACVQTIVCIKDHW